MAEKLSKKFCLELSVMFLHVFLKTSTRKNQYIISEDAALTLLKGCGNIVTLVYMGKNTALA